MSNLLKNNAYHILGLDASAAQRDIQKRSKEIIKFLQIDDTPEYDLDLGVFDNFRTEESVKEAVQKLTSPKKQIKDYFFWFRIEDEVDEQAVGILRKKDPEGAIRVWEHHSDGDSTKAMFYKKNLALLYCILLFKEDNKRYLKDSLRLWHELMNSPKFWSAFAKVYKHNDELDTDQEIIADFQKHATSFLSDLYTEISHAHKDDSYIAEFTKVFHLRGEKTEKVVMAPIFQEITEAVEQLEKMNVSEDGDLDAEEAAAIKKHIVKIQECCNKLIDLGLYDDSQSKTIRDRAAAAIRSIVIDIHNNLDDLPKAEQLLKIAMQFVGTSGMENKLKQDLDQFEKNKKFSGVLEPIMALMNDKKYDEAMALIDKEKEANKDPEFQKAMDAKKKEAVTMAGVTEFLAARKEFEAKNWDKAIPMFERAASVIYENIDIFDVNKEVIDSWLETIKSNVKILTADNADKVDEVHNKMKKQIDDAFDERLEQLAIKVLIDSYYYVGMTKVIKEKKGGGGWGWSWLWWIIGFIIIKAIFSGN
jgi:tetratricopeptide (TPR) repeat protein